MSSPAPELPPRPQWTSQHNQQTSTQHAQPRSSQAHPSNQSYYTQSTPYPKPYAQPYYGSASPAPYIAELPAPLPQAPPAPYIAELPAPLPPAPPTITSDEQLKHDELLAHKLQNMEVEEVRRRSSSTVSQQQRSASMMPSNPHSHPTLLHQVSSLSLRPHPTNFSSDNTPWSPGSFGPAPSAPGPSTLPEVVVAPRSIDPSDDLPIPVLLDRNTDSLPPLKISGSAALNSYLEKNRQVPYPPTWRLSPVIATFYAYDGSKIASGADWLSQQESFTWRTVRPTEHAYNPSAPSYSFRFATRGGTFRDPKFSWFMTTPELAAELMKKATKRKPTSWTYDLHLDRYGGMRKTEVLGHGRDLAILTTYIHASNYDSLRFVGPEGRAYMWVSSGTVSSVNGSRYDTVRHALFAATGQIPDPLYGEIVADHTFWDGYVDEHEIHAGVKCDGCRSKPINGLRWKCQTCQQHDVCSECRRRVFTGGYGASMQKTCKFSLVCLPDEALYIRSSTVDPALVVATLQVLKDWERHTLRDEKRTNPKGFLASEAAARNHDLGIVSYWNKSSKANGKAGTVVKAKSTAAAFEEAASALGGLVDAGFALAGHGTSGGVHAGDGGGGGDAGAGGGGGS